MKKSSRDRRVIMRTMRRLYKISRLTVAFDDYVRWLTKPVIKVVD